MPGHAKSHKSALYWKSESAYATFPSGNFNTLPINSETLDETIDKIQTDDIASNRENQAIRGGNISTQGQIIHDLTPVRTLAWFRHLLAASSIVTSSVSAPSAVAGATAYNRGDYVLASVGGAIWVCTRGGTTPASMTGVLTGTGVVDIAQDGTRWEYVAANGTQLYQHVITPSVDFPTVGLAFEKAVKGGDEDIFIKHVGARFQSLDLSVPQSGPVKATWGVITQRADSATSTGAGTPTLLAEEFYRGQDAYVHVNDTQGAGGKMFKDFSAMINNGVDENCFGIGERYRLDIPEGKRVWSGRVSLGFSDRNEYTYFKNETEVALAVSFIAGGKLLKIEWPEVKLMGNGSPKISGNQVITQDFDWEAYYLDGSHVPGRVTAINTTAAASIPV
jgi:hypothetical protein